ncbi:MAG: stage II sporulation protein M [Archangium sp.]|nr:stage II sporulation protein M [Archangium sp.]
MDVATFMSARRPRWESLQRLLERAEQVGLRGLSLDEAKSLARLYRAASSDLLWARAHDSSADVTGFLNDLVGRAYALTTPGRRFRWGDAWRFVTTGFPATVRAEWRACAASVLVFFAGAAFGWVGMAVDPRAAPYLVPEQHLDVDPAERAAQEAKAPGVGVEAQAAFSSFLFTHNISVAFFCFALGLTAGVGTAIMLFSNGLMLGALAWVYASKGLAGWFWAWILPHGVPEITAICIAGAAGFIVARGIVAPGALSRRDAVRSESVVAVRLVFGTLVLFVVAGCIEGTISQIHPPALSVEFKLGFAAVVAIAVYAYLGAAWLRSFGASAQVGLTTPHV